MLSDDDRQIIKLLHQPIAPYLSESYNLLIQLIQSFVLGTTLIILADFKNFNIAYMSKIIIVILIIALIWHCYLVHDQFLVTRAGPQDTIIPISLAILQVLLVIVIPLQIYLFTFIIMLITITSSVVYLNLFLKYQKPIAKTVFKIFYREQGNQFAEDFHTELMNFDKLGITLLSCISIILGFLTIFNNFAQIINETQKTYLSVLLIGSLIVLLFILDLRYYLNHSKKLEKYEYHW